MRAPGNPGKGLPGITGITKGTAMNPHGPEYAAYQRLVRDHESLKKLLDRIEQALRERSGTIDQIGDLLGKLGDRLVKHFALEEDGGYFAEALLHAPQLVSKANSLLAQHPKMSQQAKTLIEGLRTPSAAGTDWWEETRARFLAFREELLRHEKSENGLLQEAYVRDLGAHD